MSYICHHDLVNRYGTSVSHMITDTMYISYVLITIRAYFRATRVTRWKPLEKQ